MCIASTVLCCVRAGDGWTLVFAARDTFVPNLFYITHTATHPHVFHDIRSSLFVLYAAI